MQMLKATCNPVKWGLMTWSCTDFVLCVQFAQNRHPLTLLDDRKALKMRRRIFRNRKAIRQDKS